MSTIRETALQALVLVEEREAEDRSRREADRRRMEADEDKATLEWVAQHRVSEWFPDAEWVLVDRSFPQKTAVIHAVDDPKMLLIVTKGQQEVLVPAPGSQGKAWLVGAGTCRSLADIGRWIRQQESRPAEAVE